MESEFAMKAYRITYRPYTKEVVLEEHYDGGTPEWQPFTQDRYSEGGIYAVLNNWKSLQVSGWTLINAINERQAGKPQSKEKKHRSVLFYFHNCCTNASAYLAWHSIPRMRSMVS